MQKSYSTHKQLRLPFFGLGKFQSNRVLIRSLQLTWKSFLEPDFPFSSLISNHNAYQASGYTLLLMYNKEIRGT
jgi:hypothetical protein